MKITFVLSSPNLCGGVRVVAIYADQLRRRGHEVSVVSVPLARPSLRHQLKTALKSLLKFTLPPRYVRAEESHLDYVDVPHRMVDHDPPLQESDLPDADVIIATWWETAEWIQSYARAKGVKVHFVQHHEVFEYLPIDRVKAAYALPMYKITPTVWLADLLRDQYRAQQVALVPNSVDTQQFYAPVRAKQPIPTVGMVYSTVSWKDARTGLEAFRLATQKIPNLRLVAFGRGDIAPHLPLPENAEYHQKPDQAIIRTLYASCDAWIFSSLLEGFGLPVLEAMACRCPVVSTLCGGPKEIIEHGKNGFLVPVGDAAALADYLVQIVTLSEADWSHLSQAAYTKATSYTWEDATDKFEFALQQAISHQHHPDSNLKPV